MSMETLTLARYILELSLMEYNLITVRDSMLAAAALYIAQKMRKEGVWVGACLLNWHKYADSNFMLVVS